MAPSEGLEGVYYKSKAQEERRAILEQTPSEPKRTSVSTMITEILIR